MKLWVLLYLVSLSLVSSASVQVEPEAKTKELPPVKIKAPDAKTEDTKKDQPPAPAARGNGKLIAQDGTCGGKERLLCDYGMTCQSKMVYSCKPLPVKPSKGERNGPCKADKTCKAGLSCSTEKSGNGVKKHTCVNSLMPGDICKDKNHSAPCPEGYECVGGEGDIIGRSLCKVKGYIDIVGPFRPCGEGTQAECGPGLECIEIARSKFKQCRQPPLKYADDNKLLKEADQCQGEDGKEKKCADGLTCVLEEMQTGKDRKKYHNGFCRRLGLQGQLCEGSNDYKRPCDKGYECVSGGPVDSNEKYCMKKGHKFVATGNYDGCGPETRNFCGPGFECIDSKIRYPKKKICLKKGEKETPLPNYTDTDDRVPAGEILTEKPPALKKPAPKPNEKKEDEKKDEAKPEVKKQESKPEEKKEKPKQEEKKDESEPEEKKDETKPEVKKQEAKPEEKKDDKSGAKGDKLNKLDVESSADLIKQIKKIHESFAKAPTYKDEPDVKTIRPLFATAKVVNEAYSKWTGVAGSQPCKDNIVDAIFSTPKECMKKLDPKNMPKIANYPRLVAREQCITTDVRCVDENVFKITAKDLLKDIKKQWKGVDKTAFWSPKRLFAPQKVVEEAWELWSKESLSGKGYKNKEGICGRPKRTIQVSGGSLIAVFAQNNECADEEAAPTCQNMIVECL